MKVRKEYFEGIGIHAKKYVLLVDAHLTKIGSQTPYFSITGEIREPVRVIACGCLHDDILKHFPEYADLVEMHLSDINGIPMHAIENGWYWLAGSLDLHLEYGPEQTPEECLKIFCKHCRINESEARDIQDRVMKAIALTPGIHGGLTAGKNTWIRICDGMKERWNREAVDLIAKYPLPIEGR